MINALNYRSLHKFRLYFLLFRICFEMSKLWFYDLLTGYWCISDSKMNKYQISSILKIRDTIFETHEYHLDFQTFFIIDIFTIYATKWPSINTTSTVHSFRDITKVVKQFWQHALIWFILHSCLIVLAITESKHMYIHFHFL